jgi:hypothetical protein
MESVSGVFVPAETLAADQGVSVDDIVAQVKAGNLTGRHQSTGWHVLVQMPSDGAVPAATQPESGGPVAAGITGAVTLNGQPEVVVKNVNIGLGTMVGLILKFVVALAISGLILGGLGMVVMLLIENFGQGLIDTAMQIIGPYLPQ